MIPFHPLKTLRYIGHAGKIKKVAVIYIYLKNSMIVLWRQTVSKNQWCPVQICKILKTVLSSLYQSFDNKLDIKKISKWKVEFIC